MTDEKKHRIEQPDMVVCARCGLLLGWTEAPVLHPTVEARNPVYCIPCYDHVTVREHR